MTETATTPMFPYLAALEQVIAELFDRAGWAGVADGVAPVATLSRVCI